MIQARPGAPFETFLTGAPTGLVGTLTWRLIDPPEGTIVIAETTDGIIESAAGTYTFAPDNDDGDPTPPSAPDDAGTYLIVWANPALDIEVTEELVVTGTLPDYTPTVDDVGALLRARTKVGMTEVGTFNTDTRPTGVQVEGLIAHAVADVAMRVGVSIPEDLNASGRHVVSLRAAQLVELGFFPEQQEGGQVSPYQTLRLSYEEALDKLVKAVQIRSLFAETVEETA